MVSRSIRGEISLGDSAKKVFVRWVRLINAQDRYYIAKALEIFMELSAGHQRGFLSYIVEQIPRETWEKALPDPTQYLDVMRSVLYYYSGRETLSEPSKKQFGNLISEYCNSRYFRDADVPKLDLEALGDLKEEKK